MAWPKNHNNERNPREVAFEALEQSKKIEGDCWLWTEKVNEYGYGKIQLNYQSCYVHRVALWLANPSLDLRGSWKALHKPICPNRHCFNPEHLYIGTQRQNLQDRARKYHGGAWAPAPKG